jgi:uncharacterized membrane protein
MVSLNAEREHEPGGMARVRQQLLGTGGVAVVTIVGAVMSWWLRWSGLITAIIMAAVILSTVTVGYRYAQSKATSRGV